MQVSKKTLERIAESVGPHRLAECLKDALDNNDGESIEAFALLLQVKCSSEKPWKLEVRTPAIYADQWEAIEAYPGEYYLVCESTVFLQRPRAFRMGAPV